IGDFVDRPQPDRLENFDSQLANELDWMIGTADAPAGPASSPPCTSRESNRSDFSIASSFRKNIMGHISEIGIAIHSFIVNKNNNIIYLLNRLLVLHFTDFTS
ncbi:MAG: hypothetical protein H7X83_03990, partial [Verrucomicrobia bacterium]|nr:hypothetical protein [Deltaproteobacteria bacterium]